LNLLERINFIRGIDREEGGGCPGRFSSAVKINLETTSLEILSLGKISLTYLDLSGLAGPTAG